MRDVSIEVPDGRINVWHRRPESHAATAVLVHGLTGNSRWWTSVIENLPEDLGLIALDVRGRGLSIDAPPPFDLATIADDVTRSMSHFEVDKAIIAGYSMGGWIVALFGLDHPNRVERLVLIDGGFPIPKDPGADADEIIDAVVGPSLARLEIEYDSEDAFFDQWKSHPALRSHWDDSMKLALVHELGAEGDHFKVKANPDAIRTTARGITVERAPNEAAAKLEVPTHLIVVERGTMDQPGGMIPQQVAEEAASANPHLTMQYLPGVNHYTLLLGNGAPSVASAIAHG